jgi:beta-galactosidase
LSDVACTTWRTYWPAGTASSLIFGLRPNIVFATFAKMITPVNDLRSRAKGKQLDQAFPKKAMKPINIIVVVSFLIIATSFARADNEPGGPRQHLSLDLNWLFTKGDLAGAEKPDFDDQGWRTLDVPHDWSIEGPYDRTNSTGGSGGFLPAGIGWYRKHFATPAAFKDQQVTVQFDGVFMNADVYLNGHQIGHHPYGYTSFKCDLTPFLAAEGKDNVLAVRVANSTEPNSRWYTGSGIYRHVWVDVTRPVHVATWGIYVTTPKVSTNTAEMVITTRIQNDTGGSARVRVHQDLIDAAGKVVASVEGLVKVPAQAEKELQQTISVTQPQLWTLDNPARYTVRTRLINNRAGDAPEIIDSYDTSVGIRQIEFDADRGFFLNGRHVKILGMCLHHDGGAVGAAVPIEIWERRLTLLKAMGCNAIRCSHNPPAPEFLDLCDRLGILVMDEAFDEWTVAKGELHGSYSTLFNEWSEKDLTSMLRRDRNHPSIILWSIGNEIPQQSSDLGVNLARKLTAICHAEDPTRPVTSACDQVHSPSPSWPEFVAALDVAGYNYIDRWGRFREIYFSEDREKHPQFKILGTEDVCVGGVRGNYFDANPGEMDGVPLLPYASNMIRAEQLWKFNAVHDYVLGYFMWTGIDYLGEARSWPRKSASSGVLDTCGFPKDGYYFYQSQWTSAPMVHVLPDWNYPGKQGTIIPVVVYSNCREVELQLNGRSYGTKSLVFPRPGSTRTWNEITPTGTTADLHLTWDVPFEPGTLRVIGRRDGQIVAQEEIHTAGAPAAIALKCDKAALNNSTRGVAQIEIRILDAEGNIVPTASNLITFAVQGSARIIGVDNGDSTSHDSYQASTRPAFNGMALAIVQAGKTPGHVTVTAKAEGLKDASIEFEVQPGMAVATLP